MKTVFLPSSSVLLTDFYQLTMMQAYFDLEMFETAVFELFVRKLPPRRNFLMAAGLEQALDFLETLRFTPTELDWLAQHGSFKPRFIDYLAKLRFTGHVHALSEGSIFFQNEPVLRITAPLPEAQLVESRLINLIHFQTLIASKAARSVLAAPDKLLVDFGFRRAHGSEAGLYAARASFLVGFSGTATVLAGARFNIPLFGTMAHSFVEAHQNEAEAFIHFAQSLPERVMLLIDTYDTERAAQKIVALAPYLQGQGISIQSVRLDSGDLGKHARSVRKVLDDGGLTHITVFASNRIDEEKIQQLLQEGCPIDGFGVGTRMDTSADAPHLDCAYKLQEYAGRPCAKRSEGKATWPGRKQVYRHFNANGHMCRDVITVEDDLQEGTPLIHPVMQAGQRLMPGQPLTTLQAYAQQQLSRLPPSLQSLRKAAAYPVEMAPALQALAQRVKASLP